MRKASLQISALLYLIAFIAVGGSTTIPGKDRSALLSVSPAKALLSKADKPLSAANAEAKDDSEDPNITDAPDPATPLLVGSGLIALSLVWRRRRRNLSDEETE